MNENNYLHELELCGNKLLLDKKELHGILAYTVHKEDDGSTAMVNIRMNVILAPSGS